MKKFLCFILTLSVILSSACVFAEKEEMRAVWFSYEDYRDELASLSKEEFLSKADAICKNIRESGMNTLIFHVRAFSDAFYDSSLFTYSKYVCGQAGVAPGYDPLALMCDVARQNDVDIHAWINPYRIGSPQNVTEGSVAYAWKNEFGNERVCEVNGSWYYNPASAHVRQYIVDGVAEIVKNYPVDGIHFDDYFYPVADESFDIDSYKSSQSPLTLEQWRIENVNSLIKATYDTIKSIDSSVAFGISPNADIEKNYSSLFADVKKWAREKGYADYLAPQIYFGYQNSTMPYDRVLKQWCDLCEATELYIGLAIYKSGKEDRWAGDGKAEWLQSNDICARQISDLRSYPSCGGFMLFNYSAMFSENATESAKNELASISKTLSAENEITPMKAFLAVLNAVFNIFD